MKAIIAILGGKRATAFAIAAVLALGLAGIQTLRLSHAQAALADARALAAEQDAALAEANRLASERARRIEHELSTRIDAVAGAYERGKQDAQRTADRVAADLRAGNLRLRDEIRALAARGLPGDPAAAGELAAAAERGEAYLGAAVGVGADCDAAQRALIDAYDAARDMTDGQHPGRTE